MTEAEVAMAAMTLDELREAGEYIEKLRYFFKQSGGTIEHGQVAATQGPQLALDALFLAWLREVTVRYGGPEWFAGMPLDDHQAGRLVGILLERMATIPEGERRLRQKQVEPAFFNRRTCTRCGQRKIASPANFPVVDGDYLSVICTTCVESLQIRSEELAREREEAIAWGLSDVPEEEQRVLATQIAEAMDEPAAAAR